MQTSTELKNERINLRLNGSLKTLLERAASFEGKTVSNFIINSAMERAEETVRKHESISLNEKNSKVFLNALSGSVKFNKKLTDALGEHSQRVNNK